MKSDCVILCETELVFGDIPTVPGYKSFLPQVSNSAKVRTVLLIKTALHPEQLHTSADTDIQVVAAKVGSDAIVGIYRQFANVSNNGTTRGHSFETKQLENIIEAVRGVSEKHKVVYVAGDMNLDLVRTEDTNYYRQQLLQKWMSFTEEHGLKWSRTGPPLYLMDCLVVTKSTGLQSWTKYMHDQVMR